MSLPYLVPRAVRVDLGSPTDGGHTTGFFRREQAPDGATYRWSGAASQVVFPGLGLAPATVGLQLSSGRPAGSAPVPITVTINDGVPTVLTLTRDSLLYTLPVPAATGATLLTGDLVLHFSSPTTYFPNDSRALGFVADFMSAAPAGPSAPAPLHVAAWLVGLALLYMLARRLGWRRWVALALAGAPLLPLTVGLVVARLWVTSFSLSFIALLLLAHAALWVVDWAGRAVARWALPGRAWGRTSLGWRLFLSLFVVALLLKVGGVLYPYSFLVDAEFHLRMLDLLNMGQFPEQHTLALSVMPKSEWKQRVFIPYSPFFYYVAAPLSLLPWPLATTVPVTMALLDAFRTPLTYLLALRLGPGPGRALGAAALFTFIPATYVVQQFANWPTQISLWLTLLWLVAVVLLWERLFRPGPLLLVGGLLGLAFVSYTVTAGYIGLIFGGYAVVGLVVVRGAARRPYAALLAAGGIGLAFAFLAFYGLYIGEFLTVSIPSLLNSAASTDVGSAGSVTTRPGGLGGFLFNVVARQVQSYALVGVFAVAAGGLGLAWGEWRARLGKRTWGARPSWAFGLLVAWVISLPLFTAADYVVDQAFKEYWFSLPALAIFGGPWVGVIFRRGRGGVALAGLLAIYFVWASVSLWVFRLFFH